MSARDRAAAVVTRDQASTSPGAGVEVEVGWTDLAGVHDTLLEALAAVVGSTLLTQAARLRRREDRLARITAHALARHLVARATGQAPAGLRLVRRCHRCGIADHGKPSFLPPGGGTAPVEVSLSHSGRWVCAVVAPLPVGIDVEVAEHCVDWTALEALVRHPAESVAAADDDAVRRWVRKEAALKAIGEGLSTPMATVLLQDRPRSQLPGPGGSWRGTGPDGWTVTGTDLTLPAACAVAVRTSAQLRVRLDRLSPHTLTGAG